MIKLVSVLSKIILIIVFIYQFEVITLNNAWGADPAPNPPSSVSQPTKDQKSGKIPVQKPSTKTIQATNSQPAPIDTETTPLSRNGRDAIEAYRHSWNPMTAGPNYMPQADSLPEGEFNGRFFFYGALTEGEYSDSGGINGLPQGFSKNQLLALFAMFYGVDANTELVFFALSPRHFFLLSGTGHRRSGIQ